MKPSLRGTGRVVSNPQLPRGGGIWITDDVLASSFQRFVKASKRFASHVPGPLEARRRLAKRRMVGLAHPTPLGTPIAESIIGWILRTWKDRSSICYEPPWPTQKLALPLEQSLNDKPNQPDHMRWLDTSTDSGESTVAQSNHDIGHADIAVALANLRAPQKEQATTQSPAQATFDLKQVLLGFEEKFQLLKTDTCLDLRQVTVLLKDTVQDSVTHINELADDLVLERERLVKSKALDIVLGVLRSGNLRTRNLRDLFSLVSPLNPLLDRSTRLSLLRAAISELKLRFTDQQDTSDVLNDPRYLYMQDLSELDGSDLLLLLSHLSGESGCLEGMTALRAFLNDSFEAAGKGSSRIIAGTFTMGVEKFCGEMSAPERTIWAPIIHHLPTFVRGFVSLGRSSFIAEVTRLVIVHEDSWKGLKRPKMLDFWLGCLHGVPDAGYEDCYSQIHAAVWDVLAAKREPVQVLQAMQYMDNTRLAWILLRHWAIRNISSDEQGIVAATFLKRWEESSYRRRGHLDMFHGLLRALGHAKIPNDRTVRQAFHVLYRRIASKDEERALVTFLCEAPRKYTVSDRTVAEMVNMLAASDPGQAQKVAERFALSDPALIPELLVQAASLPEHKGYWVRDRLFRSRSSLDNLGQKAPSQDQAVCDLSPNFVEVVEMVALAFARNTHYTNRAAFWNVLDLYDYLEQHGAVMSATMARALVHAGIVRFLENREYLSHHRLMNIAHKVNAIEGPETADRLVRKVEMIRGNLNWHKRYTKEH